MINERERELIMRTERCLAEIDRLRTENATLRELVREAYDSAYLLTLGGEWCQRAEKALKGESNV